MPRQNTGLDKLHLRPWNPPEILKVTPCTTRPFTHSLQPVGDLLATKISGGRMEVAGWLQGGRRLVADRLQTVAGTIWSRGGFGCCKWNLSATKSIVERFLVVADRLPTGWRLTADQLQRLQTIPTQFLVADWSPTCRRSVADRSPKSCRLSAIKNKRSRYSRRPVANRLPIAPQLIAEWLPTDRRRVGSHCPITRQYSINTRSLSAPEPMLDLFSVTSSSDINLKAITWRQFYKRYFNHRSLKLTWKLFIWYFFQI